MSNIKKYQIKTSGNDGILEVAVTGQAGGSDFEILLHEVSALLKDKNAKKVIFDVCGLEQRIESGEIYRFVRNHPSDIYEIQSAFVDLPENAHYAAAFKNAGLAWEWFTDMNEARDFLHRKRQDNEMNLYSK
jgi:hypothetical protein